MLLSLSKKQLLTNLIVGGICGLLYFVFSHDSIFANRLINSFFMASLFPLIFGGFRLVNTLGAFDLFVYTHRKLWKYGKVHEKLEEENEAIAPNSTEQLGTYHEYLSSIESRPSYKEPLIAGGLYLTVSLLMTFLTL